MGSKFIKTSPATNLKVVVVYPGTGYGTQAYVEGRIASNVLPHADSQDVLIVIPERHNTAWTEVIEDIDQYARNEQLNITPGAIIGWSGGAQGVAQAIATGNEFPTILLADPSPVSGAFDDPRVRMWYQPGNWKGKYAHLGPRQAEVATRLGPRATLVQLDHNQILDEVIKTAIQEQKSFPTGLVLLVGVPVVLIAGTLLWRARR